MELKKTHANAIFITMLFSAIIIESVCAAVFWGKLDILTYNFPWAQISAHQWAGMYRPQFAGTYQVNYPPLMPTLLWPVGKLINHFGLSISAGSSLRLATSFLLIKGLGMLFQWLTAGFVYWKSKRPVWGLLLSGLILLNPSIWFNAAFWGQLDSALIFFIVVSFYYLKQERYYLASIWFALGCLTKLQFVYLVPIFGLELLSHVKWQKVLKLVGTIIGINLVGWLPFMINMKTIFLPLKVFGSGTTQYADIVENGFNFWAGALKARIWNKQLRTTDHIVGWLTYGHLNTLILVLIVLALCVWYWLVAKKRVRAIGLEYVGAIYSGLIFFFTMLQHERYQLSMLAFIILLLLTSANKATLTNRDLSWYAVLTLGTFVNQAGFYLAVYLNMQPLRYVHLIRLGGIINTLIFLLMVGLFCFKEYHDGEKRRLA
ncbi:glycosyltransferase 87 family protein [Loigolactobacillus iwatensis]|uniref:glycosyltransferase 87 family protein n=1 Tax=Loigolactobacillus iwatensis TaxID=1267156 RepID=UPI0013DE4D19|nr:glycosyltransferase 87 family protein [Loigolactobacillus iwatensis]